MRATGSVAFITLLLTGSLACAEGRPSDSLPATGGPITITPLTHATLQLTHGAHVVLVDPWHEASFVGLPKPTLILITDIHPDHLDQKALAAVRAPGTKVAAPPAVASQVEGATAIANGETKTLDGITVEGVPMYNLKRGPKPGELFHTKGRGDGFLLVLGGKRIYLAGDTECTPEMKALKNVDVAFLPMNLPYTMPVEEAAECAKAFRPKVVYPYHYRGPDGKADVKAFAAALAGTGIEVRIRDWYPATSPAR